MIRKGESPVLTALLGLKFGRDERQVSLSTEPFNPRRNAPIEQALDLLHNLAVVFRSTDELRSGTAAKRGPRRRNGRVELDFDG